jgi:hypothetical protein
MANHQRQDIAIAQMHMPIVWAGKGEGVWGHGWIV